MFSLPVLTSPAAELAGAVMLGVMLLKLFRYVMRVMGLGS